MFNVDIENIFQEEIQNMNSQVGKMDSLLMEFRDVNSKYIHLRSLFSQFTKDKTMTKEKAAELLKVHLDIINHINDINREVLLLLNDSFTKNQDKVSNADF